jgi:Tol biopolymer transport system component
LVYSSIKSFTTTDFPITRFLYVKKIGQNNVIFTSDDDGNEIQLTDSATNSWRPRKNNQSNKIAFIRSNGAQNHIYIMNPDGTNVFKVTNSVPIAGFNSDYVNFSWNANGSQLIYPNFDRLYRIGVNGSGLIQIFQTPTSKLISECDWSFDETKIAVKTNNLNGYNAEIYIISSSGVFLTQVITPVAGAVGGLNFSVSGQKLLFTRDISGFENANYRQLDTRIFEHIFFTGITSELLTQKPPGTVDLDVRYSPNEAEVIFVNTSNDFVSPRYIQKYEIGTIGSRETLFSGTTMPDWE